MMHGALPRVLPFVVFMAFIAIEELARFLKGAGVIQLDPSSLYYLYPVKTLATVAVLIYFWRRYDEVKASDLRNISHVLLAAVIGIGVFALWIQMDVSVGTMGTPAGFNPMVFENEAVRLSMIMTRLFGAAIVVPIMEELFWRSFVLRYAVRTDFLQVPIGHFTGVSFIITTVLFGLEHNLFLAGMMAGAAYNFLVYRTKSIVHCIVSHAITNLALGIYVLSYQQWHFW